jgi:hypothetical protein
MEMKYDLMYSNDPRFIFKAIRNFGGFCYYANHYEKIIRDGCFLSESRCLNGPGRLINYNDRKILITIGTFVEDVPISPYTVIVSEYPFYQIYDVELGKAKNDNQTYYCDAVQKNYTPIQFSPTGDTTELNITQFKEVKDNNYKKFIELTTYRGQLIDCDYANMPSDIKKSTYTTLCFDDIFNNDWKIDEIHKFDEYKQLFNNVENSSYMNSL